MAAAMKAKNNTEHDVPQSRSTVGLGLRIIFKNKIDESVVPYGIRDDGGFLLFFPDVQRYDGQEERYENEILTQTILAHFILGALISAQR